MYKCCISFIGYIIFHCLDTPHFNHPFSLWTQVVSTLWLLWITLIWIFMQVFMWTYVSFRGIHLGAEFGYMVTPLLTYHRTARLFSNVITIILHLLRVHMRVQFLHSLPDKLLFSTSILVKFPASVSWFCFALSLKASVFLILVIQKPHRPN